MSAELTPSKSTDERDIRRAFDKWHKKHRYADRENAARGWEAAAEYYGCAPAKPVETPAPESAILAQQVALWRKEVARLNDLIAFATSGTGKHGGELAS